jgi:hypothetical protein
LLTPLTTILKPPAMNGSAPDLDAVAFVAAAERITNEGAIDEALGLFHEDCVAEWVFDGMYERHEGIDAIGKALAATLAVGRDHQMSGRKTLECADGHTIVNTWRGGFGDEDRQFGTEIWTLRDGLVVHHQMYLYLRLTKRWSPLGVLRQTRVLITSPRIALSQLKHERRAASSRGGRAHAGR